MADEPNSSSSAAAFALRPLTTGELIDRAFQLYRRHFMALFFFSALIQMFPFVFGVVMTSLMDQAKKGVSEPTATIWLSVAVLGVLAMLIGIFGNGAITHYIGHLYLGRVRKIADSFTALLRRGWPLFYTFIFQFVILILSLSPIIIPIVLTVLLVTHFNFILLLSILLLGVLALCPFIMLAMLFLLTTQAVMLEDKNGFAALKRSWQIIRYNPKLGFMYWGETRISILLLLVALIHMLFVGVSHIPQMISGITEMARGNFNVSEMPTSPVMTTISHLLSFLCNSLITPLYVIVETVFYYDVRVRKEAFDLELITETLPSTPPSSPATNS